MAWKGYRKPLENTDLWDLKPEDQSTTIVPMFNKYWEQSLNKAAKKEA
jgi:ATP-binding cassette subfamily C (CFTR/MRP) protein 1